jgi:uncharacterized protein YqhQ
MFGEVQLSFPLHCYETAQSYFDASVSFTTTYIIFFLIPGSIILFAILKSKKLKFSIVNIILIGLVVSVISFGVLQVWLSTNKNFDEKGILKILHPICF